MAKVLSSSKCPFIGEKSDENVVFLYLLIHYCMSIYIISKYFFLQTIQIHGLDDGLPELAETFTVRLINVSSSDPVPGVTPTSGASISPEYNENQITIFDNDYPYGLFQFWNEPPANISDIDEPIAPLTVPTIVCKIDLLLIFNSLESADCYENICAVICFYDLLTTIITEETFCHYFPVILKHLHPETVSSAAYKGLNV